MLAVLSNPGRQATLCRQSRSGWSTTGRQADSRQAMRSVRRPLSGRIPWRRSAFSSGDRKLPPTKVRQFPRRSPHKSSKPARRPKASTIGAWWRSLGRWQWPSIAGAAALASILVVAGLPVLQQMMSGGGPLQVAMVTINDRSPLFEPSDLRMRVMMLPVW